jgi:hypothetical protein
MNAMFVLELVLRVHAFHGSPHLTQTARMRGPCVSEQSIVSISLKRLYQRTYYFGAVPKSCAGFVS